MGVPLGCIAGISLTVAAAKWLPQGVVDVAAWRSRIYYAAFLLAVLWALTRGAARSGAELLWAAAMTTALIPFSSFMSVTHIGWSHGGADHLVDMVALAGAIGFACLARAARRRSIAGPHDSIWSSAPKNVGVSM